MDLALATGTLLEEDPDFDLAAPAQLSTLVFRYRPDGMDPDTADAVNLHIRKSLFASGEAVVAGTRVDGRHYLKFTLLNAETTPEDIRGILSLIRHTGAAYPAGAAA